MCAELCADLTQAQLQGGGVAVSEHSFQGAVLTLKDEPSPARPLFSGTSATLTALER